MGRTMHIRLSKKANDALERFADEYNMSKEEAIGRGIAVLDIARKQGQNDRDVAVVASQPDDRGHHQVIGKIDWTD